MNRRHFLTSLAAITATSRLALAQHSAATLTIDDSIAVRLFLLTLPASPMSPPSWPTPLSFQPRTMG
jgi:hypothetical protein